MKGTPLLHQKVLLRVSCALFPLYHHQQHLNHSSSPHNNHLTTNHQPPQLQTCLPTSDPAAPTRLVTRYDINFNANVDDVEAQ